MRSRQAGRIRSRAIGFGGLVGGGDGHEDGHGERLWMVGQPALPPNSVGSANQGPAALGQGHRWLAGWPWP